jgi:hypothetical protein
MTFNSARSPAAQSLNGTHRQPLEEPLEQHWPARAAGSLLGGTAKLQQTLQQRLQEWGNAALNAWATRPEPRISKTMTADGPQWLVYDPWGDRTHRFSQESEVRVWLEQRYYQN